MPAKKSNTGFLGSTPSTKILIMPGPPRAEKTKEMSNSDRERVVLTLIESMVDGQLPKGKISEVAAEMSFSRQTISSIWGASKRARANGNVSLSAVHKKYHSARATLNTIFRNWENRWRHFRTASAKCFFLVFLLRLYFSYACSQYIYL